jgi:hypothetical protein
MTRIHPEGGVQEAGGEEIVVGKRDAISVGEAVGAVGVGEEVAVTVWMAVCVIVGVGKLRGSVGGIWVGVARDGKFSAMDIKMPPITRPTEKIAIMTPAPNWRRFCMIIPPCSLQRSFWQWAEAH